MRALIFEDTPPPTDHHAYPNIPDSPSAAVSYDWEARRQLFRQLTSPDAYGWTNLHNVTAPTLLIAGQVRIMSSKKRLDGSRPQS